MAGLQAIATARRLGGAVEAYDLRPVVKEQVESLGARFVELDLDVADAEDSGGYARAQDDDFYRKQRESMGRLLRKFDVVITTAAVPGKKAPVLITSEMVSNMAPGSMILDLAAERGGNCELTRPGEEVDAGGVVVIGPENLPSTVPYHASQMYAHNVSTLLLHLIDDGHFRIDRSDEITSEILVAHDGQVVHAQVADLLNPSTATAHGT